MLDTETILRIVIVVLVLASISAGVLVYACFYVSGTISQITDCQAKEEDREC